MTNINGCNEIIQDNQNGLIVEPKDVDDLYDAMKRYLKEGLSHKLSLHSRDDIMKKYDRKVFYQYLLNEYNEVLGNA